LGEFIIRNHGTSLEIVWCEIRNLARSRGNVSLPLLGGFIGRFGDYDYGYGYGYGYGHGGSVSLASS